MEVCAKLLSNNIRSCLFVQNASDRFVGVPSETNSKAIETIVTCKLGKGQLFVETFNFRYIMHLII